LRPLLDAAAEGTLVLDDVEELDLEMQDELLHWIEGVGACAEGRELESASRPDAAAITRRAPRLLATTRQGLAPAAQAGKLRHDLALRLQRLQLRVPALKERREDVLPLVQCLAQRFAEEEDVTVPSFADEALALLWRQPWEGNVRELENVVYKLVILPPSEAGGRPKPIDAEHVARVARSFDLELVRKLNSRHPSRTDLLAALRVTRLGAGRINKTRAALFMGWDPDTLVARMDDLGLDERTELDPSAWAVDVPRPSARPSAEGDSA
jgi:DNA-binding NtrC family response regulator